MALLITIFLLYWLPTLIAIIRASPNAMAIAALNFLLGWTVLGWIWALVWSLAAVHRHQSISVRVENNHVIGTNDPQVLDQPVPKRLQR